MCVEPHYTCSLATRFSLLSNLHPHSALKSKGTICDFFETWNLLYNGFTMQCSSHLFHFWLDSMIWGQYWKISNSSARTGYAYGSSTLILLNKHRLTEFDHCYSVCTSYCSLLFKKLYILCVCVCNYKIQTIRWYH